MSLFLSDGLVKREFTIPRARVQTLFSSPLKIAPALAGVYYAPMFVSVTKFPGAYTNPENVSINAAGAGIWLALDSLVMTASAASYGAAFFDGSLGFGSSFNPAGVLGRALVLTTDGENPAGNGGDLRVSVWYFVVRV